MSQQPCLLSASQTSSTSLRLQFAAPVPAENLLGRVGVAGAPVFAAVPEGDSSVVRLETHYLVGDAVTIGVLPDLDPTTWPLGDTSGCPMMLPTTVLPTTNQVIERFEQGIGNLLAKGWHAVDDPLAVVNGPSSWQVIDGELVESSGVFGGEATDRFHAEKPGTFFVATQLVDADVVVQAKLSSDDDDGIGLVARYRGPDQHYRFQWFREGEHRELVRVSGNQTKRLALDMAPYPYGQPRRVRLAVEGSHIAVFVGERLVLAAEDPDPLPAGATGVWSWGNAGSRFDDFVAAAIPTDNPFASPSQQQGRNHTGAPISGLHPLVADPTSTSVLAWARASGPARVTWELSRSADFVASRFDADLVAESTDDFTSQTELSGLEADTEYWARPHFSSLDHVAPDNVGPSVHFRTLPAPATSKPLVFAFGADITVGNASKRVILDEMRDQNPLFFLSLGDLPYVDHVPGAYTQADYWDKHKETRGLPEVAALAAAMPWIATWDDHEIRDNWDASTSAGWVQLGTRAWRDYFPVRAESSSAIYRKFSVGPDVEVFFLDTRSQRDSNDDPDGPGKSMLETEQLNWLKNGLLASTARLKIIASSVPLRFGTTENDYWEGFASERTALFDFLTANDISGIVFLSGDQHWSAVHHHPEGYVEVMACPLTAHLRQPPLLLPSAVTFLAKEHSYGLVRVNPSGSGFEAVVEIWGLGHRLLHTEVIDAP